MNKEKNVKIETEQFKEMKNWLQLQAQDSAVLDFSQWDVTSLSAQQVAALFQLIPSHIKTIYLPAGLASAEKLPQFALMLAAIPTTVAVLRVSEALSCDLSRSQFILAFANMPRRLSTLDLTEALPCFPVGDRFFSINALAMSDVKVGFVRLSQKIKSLSLAGNRLCRWGELQWLIASLPFGIERLSLANNELNNLEAASDTLMHVFQNLPTSMKYLDLSGNLLGLVESTRWLHNNLLSWLPNSLTSLDLGGNHLDALSDEALRNLLHALPEHLAALSLRGELFRSPNFVGWLPCSLKTLDLTGCLLRFSEQEWLTLFANMSYPVSITHLNLSGCLENLAPATIRSILAHLPPSVRVLQLDEVSINKLQAVFSSLPETLEALDIRSVSLQKFSSEQLQTLLSSLKPTVHTLRLNIDLTDAQGCLKLMRDMVPPTVTRIGFSSHDSMISSQNFSALQQAVLALPPSITSLDLSQMQLTSMTPKQLMAFFSQLPTHLTELDLSENGLNYLDAPVLSAVLASIPAHVTRVDLTKNHLLPPEPAMNDTSLGRYVYHSGDRAETVDDRDMLQELTIAVKSAVEAYADWYEKKNYNRASEGWFTRIRHGRSGQNRAKDLLYSVQGASSYEAAIDLVAKFLESPKTRYHRHSFATYLLDFTERLPHTPWYCEIMNKNNETNRYIPRK